ncbi:MAG: hypothetical protein U9Q06_02635 [Nanoarchaeota archaeon]|nr:hypothetical protein [Nanoarchaeota archaeon]
MKKIKLILLGIFFLSFICLATANEIDSKVSELNQLSGEELPGIAGTLFGNERINLFITSNTGEIETIGIVTENKFFISLEQGELTDPTLSVYTDETTLRTIQDSEDTLKAFQEALDNKTISYKAIGFRKKIKFGFLKLIVKVANWFN